jgi:hypothetical protein
MAGRLLGLGALLAVLASPIPSLAADSTDAQGAGAPAAAAVDKAPPEKVKPNVSTAPGVIAPKPTPPAEAIAPSPPSDAAPKGADTPQTGATPNAK